MQYLYFRIVEVLHTGETEYAEIWGSFLTLFWGIGLMFVPMQALAIDPAVIGALMIMVSVLKLFGIRGRNYLARRAGALSALMLWMTVAALSLDSHNAWSILIASTGVYAGANAFWNYHRIGLKRDFHLRMMQLHNRV